MYNDFIIDIIFSFLFFSIIFFRTEVTATAYTKHNFLKHLSLEDSLNWWNLTKSHIPTHSNQLKPNIKQIINLKIYIIRIKNSDFVQLNCIKEDISITLIRCYNIGYIFLDINIIYSALTSKPYNLLFVLLPHCKCLSISREWELVYIDSISCIKYNT